MKNMLILGGTGIVGTATALEALDTGFNVTVSGIDPSPLDNTRFIHADDLDKEDGSWDAIFDVYTFGRDHAENTYRRFKGKTDHIFIMSSTLVYDRTTLSFDRIKPDHRRANKDSQGGYVNHKVALEEFWTGIDDMNWTILRPYHIIGKGSELGCLPPHNRDPKLVDKIRLGRIGLCDGGRVPINIVHPRDIGRVVLNCMGRNFGKAYNVVNPKEVIARNYYSTIAKIIGIDLKIDNIPGEEIWSSGEWKLTTLPHLYDVSDLERDCSFVPSCGLEESLKDALEPLSSPKFSEKNIAVYQRMHMSPEPTLHRYFD